MVVLPPPDRRVFPAELIGRDPQTDQALLKIDAPNLAVVRLGSSSDLRIGQWVVAIGNALALPGGPTVSAGIISALNRHEQEPTLTATAPGLPGPRLSGLILTDAAINHGNSGGPLFNLRGEVVGVNTLITENAQTVGYAIAIDTAKPMTLANERHGLLLSASPSMAGGSRGLWALRIPLEHLGARVFPDMFSLAQAHQAFDASGGIANPQLADWFQRNIVAFLDLVEAAKHYPCANKAWIEFLGELPTPETTRVE